MSIQEIRLFIIYGGGGGLKSETVHYLWWGEGLKSDICVLFSFTDPPKFMRVIFLSIHTHYIQPPPCNK